MSMNDYIMAVIAFVAIGAALLLYFAPLE